MKSRFLIPLLLCLAFAAQGLWFIGTQSLTFDEPVHMVAGLDIWQAGKFVRWNDHPPLSRALFALPLLGKDWGIDFVYRPDDWNDHSVKAWLTWVPRDPQGIAWRARSMNLLLGLAMGILLWIAARRLFSVAAANLALLLFAFTPCLIAHFSVATTDGAGVLMIFAVAMQVVAWRRDPSRFHTILLGLALGGMLIAKFYTPPLFVLAVGLTLSLDRGRHWRKVAGAAAIAFLVIFAAYRFHVSWLVLQNGQLAMHSPGSVYKLVSVPKIPSFSIPIPAGEYLTGLIDVFRHNRWGHPSFLLGEISQSGGWKLYYPILILLKWPTVVLLLCLSDAASQFPSISESCCYFRQCFCCSRSSPKSISATAIFCRCYRLSCWFAEVSRNSSCAAGQWLRQSRWWPPCISATLCATHPITFPTSTHSSIPRTATGC